MKEGVLEATETHTICPWKGEASYYDVVVGDQRIADAAWYYPTPMDAAKEITGRVAFWKGVEVTEGWGIASGANRDRLGRHRVGMRAIGDRRVHLSRGRLPQASGLPPVEQL